MEQRKHIQNVLSKKLGCLTDMLVLDAATERVYIAPAEQFNALLQQQNIREVSNGGGYHFVLPLTAGKITTYWKITLASAETEAFERTYASRYTIRHRKRMPGAFC